MTQPTDSCWLTMFWCQSWGLVWKSKHQRIKQWQASSDSLLGRHSYIRPECQGRFPFAQAWRPVLNFIKVLVLFCQQNQKTGTTFWQSVQSHRQIYIRGLSSDWRLAGADEDFISYQCLSKPLSWVHQKRRRNWLELCTVLYNANITWTFIKYW